MNGDLPTSRSYVRSRWAAGGIERGSRDLPEETAIALVHDAVTTAVMMATPADLEDFGVGFSLNEGLIQSADEITAMEVVPAAEGIEVRMWLKQPASAIVATRRRTLAGPTGCGLCGIDSLAEASRPPPRVPALQFTSKTRIHEALADLARRQDLGARTRAVHAAGWWNDTVGMVDLREDVGRHNALDKLTGAGARDPHPFDEGLLLLTSRVSVEMVQKAAMMGVEILVAVSAPTALAVRTAQAAGMTLVAVAREDAFEVFTHPERVVA